jgi:type IV secretion system protein VirB5
MKRRAGLVAAGAALLFGLAATPAQAAMAVIDVAAIKQLLSQVSYWKEQIAAMKNELKQLQRTHDTLNGPRGMEALLPLDDGERNYLPRDWAEVARVLAGESARYAALGRAVSGLTDAHAVLTPERLAGLTAAERNAVLESRRSSAGLAVLSREAYATAGARFASLEQLVRAIGEARDAKAVLDLQGRIAAEQAMLENEQAKLAALHRAAEADRWVREQQLRELAIAGHGEFATRLRPVPPRD